MSAPEKLFLMIDEQRSYAELVSGPDPCAAVETHYAMLDAWCSPSPDAEISEEFLRALYEVPIQLADQVRERFENLDGDEMAAQVAALLGENPSLVRFEVNVIYTAVEGAKASELPSLPDLFSGHR